MILSNLEKNSIRIQLLNLTLMVIGIPTIIYCVIVSSSMNDGLNLVWILPLSYFVLMFLGNKNKKLIFTNIGCAVLNVSMLIRYVLIPVQLCYNRGFTNMLLSSSKVSTFDSTIWLMIYELVCIFLVINLFAKHYLDRYELDKKRIIRFNKNRYNFIVRIFISFFFITLLMFPSLLNNFILINAKDRQVVNLSISSQGIPLIIYEIGLIFIYLSLMIKLYTFNNCRQSGIKLVLSSLLSVVLIASNWTAGGGAISRWSFILYSIACIALMIRLYRNYKKTIIMTFVPTGIALLLIMSIAKYGGGVSIKYIINYYLSLGVLDSYFGGLYSVNIGMNAAKIYKNFLGMDTLFTDLFSAVPIISGLFDATTNSSQVFYHAYINRSDFIIPTICQGYGYFGFWGAPIFSILLTFLSVFFGDKVNKTDNVFLFFMYVILAVWFSLFIELNIFIIQQHTWKRLIYLSVIFVNNKIVLKSSEVDRRRYTDNYDTHIKRHSSCL